MQISCHSPLPTLAIVTYFNNKKKSSFIIILIIMIRGGDREQVGARASTKKIKPF
jgi:hypothetical protein